MDINKALALLRDGKLRDCSLDDLRVMSAGCVVFIQNVIPDAVHLKAAIDDEIRRKETQESAERLFQQTTKLVQHSETLTQQIDRLVEESVKLTGLTRTLKWLTIVLVVFAFLDFVEFVFRLVEKLCQPH
jgi:hypothetical protein